MKTRKIFWLAVAVFAMITIGVVLYINALYFERLVPLECNVTEKWFRDKTDFLVVKNFLGNYPDAEFKNLGNKENMPMYCQYSFVAKDNGQKQMVIVLDKNLQIIRTTIEQPEPEMTSRYEKYLDENNKLNFGLQYDKSGMIVDDLQRIFDWCDYTGEKPAGWYFDWNNQTHHIDSKNCKWIENKN